MKNKIIIFMSVVLLSSCTKSLHKSKFDSVDMRQKKIESIN